MGGQYESNGGCAGFLAIIGAAFGIACALYAWHDPITNFLLDIVKSLH